MNLFETFETNVDAETQGVPICFGTDENKDPTFIVRRAGGRNRQFQARYQALTKRYERQIRQGTLPVEKQNELYMTAFVEHVLIGWKNVTDRKGEDIPFSKEAAVELFNTLPDLFDELTSQAASAETFRIEQLEEDAKK